jgi:Carboxypeptidase regulatory-like domain/TonB-dependent Receptor Plug Domain
MKAKFIAALLIVLGILSFGSTRISAQTTEGTIVGVVHDAQGAVAPGVKVTVTNAATGFTRTDTTNDTGAFRLLALPSGTYKLLAEKTGFATMSVEKIDVLVGETRTVDLSVKVASQSETVEVTGAVATVDTETQHIGDVVTQAQVTSLPLNGRDFAQLALLNPGVAASGGGGGQQGGEGGSSGYSSNGQRSSSNNFMVDGVDNNNYNDGSVGQLPSIDSIQEFQVQTNNYSAEYGRNSGSVVNLVTKSGTNKLHGSAYDFLRNDAVDARNFFANPDDSAPELRLNQFGATLGGPIKKDKTFFFVNYEGFRERAGITELTVVPTDAQKSGLFTDSMGNPVQVTVNPTSAQLFLLYPEPNTNVAGGNFVSSPILTNDTDQFLVKMDHKLNNNDSLTARYSYTRFSEISPFSGGQQTTAIPGYGTINSGSTQLASVGYTRFLSNNSINEFRFGYTRNVGLSYNEAGPQAATYGFNTGWGPNSPFNLGDIPNFTMAGGIVSNGGSISNLGPNNNNPGGTWQNTLQYVDHFTHLTARHTMVFGMDIRNIRDNRFYDLDEIGQITFTGDANPEGIQNPLVDFAEGLPSTSLHFIGDSSRSYRTTSFDFFAQDSFKLKPNLVVNYGLRYEFNTPIYDATGRATTFRPGSFSTYLSPSADQTNLATLEASGMVTEQQGGLYNSDYKNFAPRLGLAWSIDKQNTTVLRVGYGIFYDTVLGQIPGNVLLNPPYLPDFFDQSPGWPNSFAPSGFPVITVTPANMPTPYSQSWNVDIQRQLPWQMVFEAAYVGSTGTHLPRFVQIDQAYITQAQIDTLTPDVVTRMELMGIPAPVAQFLSTNISLIPPIARGPFFGYAKIFQAEDVTSSSYNGLELKLSSHGYHGLTFGIADTYSKSIDGASVFYGSGANSSTIFAQDNYNLGNERGLSDFDIRNRFVANFVYAIPTWRNWWHNAPHRLADGWTTTGILTLQTGQPFSVLTGADQSSTGDGDDRPDLIGNPNSGPKTVSQWFNTSAFTLNQPLTFGDAGRNIVTGPGFRDYDMAILKDTHITETVNLQFRAEFFNIFNHPNFALPRNVETAPGFGSLFQTPDVAQGTVGLGSGGPRLIQLALKLSF